MVNHRNSPVRREPWEKPQTRSRLWGKCFGNICFFRFIPTKSLWLWLKWKREQTAWEIRAGDWEHQLQVSRGTPTFPCLSTLIFLSEVSFYFLLPSYNTHLLSKLLYCRHHKLTSSQLLSHNHTCWKKTKSYMLFNIIASGASHNCLHDYALSFFFFFDKHTLHQVKNEGILANKSCLPSFVTHRIKPAKGKPIQNGIYH